MKRYALWLGLLLSIVFVGGAVAQTHFVPVDDTGLPYAVVVTTASVDDTALVAGDEVGIYDGELCVGAAEVTGTWPLAMTVWEGDPSQGLPGFTAGNTMIFKIWQDEEARELPAGVTYTVGNGTFGYGAYSQGTLTASSAVIEHFEPVADTGLPYALVVDEAAVDEDDLSFGDEVGVFDGDLCVGASVYTGIWPLPMTAWEGDPSQGLPGFTAGNEMEFRIWVADIDRELDAHPSYSVGDGTFGYGAYSQFTLWAAWMTPTHFDVVDPTGLPYAIVIDSIAIEIDLQPGDEVGVYDFLGGGLCVGASVFTGTWPIPMTAWESDPSQELEGFTSGNPMTYIVYSSQTNGYFYGQATYTVGDGTFGYGAFTQLWLNAIDLTLVHFNIVNPTNSFYVVLVDSARISGQPIEAGDEIAVYDGEICVGATRVVGDWPLPIVVWEASGEDPGYTEGNPMVFRMYDLSSDAEVFGRPTYTVGNGNFGDGDYARLSLRTNQPPGVFNLLTPQDEVSFPDGSQVTFTWGASTDPDAGDVVTYSVYVGTSPDDLGDPVATDLTDRSYTYTPPAGVGTYYWSIGAADNFGAMTWANQTRMFSIVDAQPPGEFHLLAPADSAGFVFNDAVTFRWRRSIHPDGSPVTYSVYVSTNPATAGTAIATGLTDTTYTYTPPATTANYYWKVMAHGPMDTFRWSTERWMYNVSESGAPDAFAAVPEAWALEAVYPNPFNATVNIVVAVPMTGTVHVAVYDVLGRRVATLVDGRLAAGYHVVSWGGVDASGVYFVRASTPDGWAQVRRLVNIK